MFLFLWFACLFEDSRSSLHDALLVVTMRSCHMFSLPNQKHLLDNGCLHYLLPVSL